MTKGALVIRFEAAPTIDNGDETSGAEGNPAVRYPLAYSGRSPIRAAQVLAANRFGPTEPLMSS